MGHKFVDLPNDGKKVYLYDYNTSTKKTKKKRQVLWGDWLKIIDNHQFPTGMKRGWLAVDWAPKQNKGTPLYIKASHTTDRRPLEIIFLDVGQGDGAILITPERNRNERIMIIDAGEGDNMHKFLTKRFHAYRGFNFYSAIITHPDKDHYLGFQSIFEDHNIGFKKIYFNGIVEKAVSGKFEKVGGLKKDSNTGLQYIEGLHKAKADIEKTFSKTSLQTKFLYPKLMKTALFNPSIKEYQMMSTSQSQSKFEKGKAFLPEFAPSNGRNYTIEVLGPVAEFKPNGDERLRKLGSYGETKNGHSIILKLEYGKFKILFGGDLNVKAEKYLLKHYAGIDRFPKIGTTKSDKMIEDAKLVFGSDVMKVCHHGASDVTDEFMQAVNPACFVISSGDSEGHVHPRPDLLGRLGKFGRGECPVILSTELQRSTREKEDAKLIKRVNSRIEKLTKKPSDSWKDKIKEDIKKLSKTNVDVYGSIYVKTDGDRMIAAFKNESNSKTKKWFYFEYKFDSNGVLRMKK
jgi:beta-lactamase superfamily II metal-dependent hydrolase